MIGDLFSDDIPSASTPANGSNGQSSLDLIKDIFGDAPTDSAPPQQQTRSNVNANIMDLFGSAPAAPSYHQQAPAASSGLGSLLGDLGDLGGLSAAPVQQHAPPPAAPVPIKAYDKNELSIVLQLQRTPEGLVNVLARFSNQSFTSDISALNLQVAVTKTQKLQLMPITSTELPAGGEATQAMRVHGSKVVCGFYSPVMCVFMG